MTPEFITYDAARPALSWTGAVEALRAGHQRPRAELGDLFLGPASGVQLTRAAFIEGLGYGVKSVTVMQGNAARGLPTVQGAMMVSDPETGSLKAIIDSRLVTELKTAADSVFGATLLARPDSRRLLIVGAGVVARSLCEAYTALFPDLSEIVIWARRPEAAADLAASLPDLGPAIRAGADLAAEAAAADIVAAATMARAPVLMGDWITPGTHVDLIGAFTAEMREADDALIASGALFVDSRETTIHHIGELKIPIAAGVIGPDHVRADFYDLAAGAPARPSDDAVTVFKNGGGAHLDLMIADWIARETA
ncbi:ornithine cyclodeaminase family protein [Rhodovulum sp. DZ06]|uniref:ornithine cyclodeaminase family protein n=1 Tax=Rhodovulum sp. DZ06 TaxID=3425126 RepID=UPI003D350825